MDNGLIESVINALPVDKMISAPLQAIITVQTLAAKSYADFLLQVCIQNDRTIAVQFDHDETVVDEKGVAQGTIQKTMCTPLLCMVVHPATAIEEGTVDFELEIMQSKKLSPTIETERSLQAKLGWGPFSVSVLGRASHKSEQARNTDTCVRYPLHTQVKRRNPSEALICVMEFLTDTVTKSVAVEGEGNGAKPLPIASIDGTITGEKVPAGDSAPASTPTTP